MYDYIVLGQYHERANFRKEYKTQFFREPYVNPLTQLRWKMGAEYTAEYFDGIQAKWSEFQAFIESIFGDNSLMLTPFKHGEPDAQGMYRPAWVNLAIGAWYLYLKSDLSSLLDRDPMKFAWGLRPPFQAPMPGQPEIILSSTQWQPFLLASFIDFPSWSTSIFLHCEWSRRNVWCCCIDHWIKRFAYLLSTLR